MTSKLPLTSGMDPQVALKRCIAALEDENSQLLKKLDKKPYLLNADVDSHQLTMIYHQLNSGADSTRGDDTCTLKPIVAMWLMEQHPTLDPVIDSHSKRPYSKSVLKLTHGL
ncbi:hypothetical protein BKA82DRAFT_4015585 [Pisolithus tinctorius]|nr:hypothetical protein BKA82DRAFT_4015585 [Pisolithus tinctorius]